MKFNDLIIHTILFYNKKYGYLINGLIILNIEHKKS